MANKVRVCHIITMLELGGAQQNTLYTVEHLDRSRFEPSLIAGPGGMLDDKAKLLNIPFYTVSTLIRPIRPHADFIALIQLYRLLRQIRPHIVHTHSSKAGIIGRLAAYLAGVPVIVHTYHGFGFTPDQKPWLFNLLVRVERFCALLCSDIVYVSRTNQEQAQQLGIGKNIPHSLIRSGIRCQMPSTSSIRHELEIPQDAWVVSSVGNFKPQKNPLELIQVALLFLENAPNAHVLIAGDGELRAQAETQAKAHEAGNRVHFLGWRQDIPNILVGSNCFLLTSRWEGLPRALVEAMAAALPTVAYAVDGVKETIYDQKTGFLIPPISPHIAVEALHWLKDHPQEAKTFGVEGKKLIQQEFDIDHMVRQQEALYETLYAAVPLKEYFEAAWTTRPE